MKIQTLFAAFILACLTFSTQAQNDKPIIYHPEADAKLELENAVKRAKAEGKHVLVQVGGNWCGWCIRFYKFSLADAQIDSTINASFIMYHLNYSKENKNLPLMAKYGYPQRFGFPVFLVIDGNGERLHTQNSAYFEQEGDYGKDKVMDFLEQWSPAALKPANYTEK